MLLLYSFEVSLTSYGLPKRASRRVDKIPRVSLVIWNAPKPMKSIQAILERNWGFINIEEMPLPAKLNAVMIF
jgi:hypothetical protein